jgi:hypothetical protein
MAYSSGQFDVTSGTNGGVRPILTGEVVGKRYTIGSFGLINTSGGGANYFPGSSAGEVNSTTFGVYQ